ncbi:hypothetical protein [Chitinimonas sp. BJB300]|uniref:hypothetical protein n=1 Tax=Chitinimonas sp. BJB300 TaxID=1559339 RepID=UPI000C10AA3A|nr:hypothetical protein [Chitinimonas sp. BJB300]PHV12324.1 hypothetical protein CSQ89_06260 [Chitinimonas sp. BJB300]
MQVLNHQDLEQVGGGTFAYERVMSASCDEVVKTIGQTELPNELKQWVLTDITQKLNLSCPQATFTVTNSAA